MNRHRDSDRDKHRHRDTDRHTQTDTQTDTKRQTQTQRDTQTHTHTQTGTHTRCWSTTGMHENQQRLTCQNMKEPVMMLVSVGSDQVSLFSWWDANWLLL